MDTTTPPAATLVVKSAPSVAARSPGLDLGMKRAEEIRHAIKALALERERLVADKAPTESIDKVLLGIRVLSDEGNNIARALQARREADEKHDERRAEQSERAELADLEARYEADKAVIAQRRAEQ